MCALIIVDSSQLGILKFSSMIAFDSGYYSIFLNLQLFAQMYHLLRSLSFVFQQHHSSVSSKVIHNHQNIFLST